MYVRSQSTSTVYKYEAAVGHMHSWAHACPLTASMPKMLCTSLCSQSPKCLVSLCIVISGPLKTEGYTREGRGGEEEGEGRGRGGEGRGGEGQTGRRVHTHTGETREESYNRITQLNLALQFDSLLHIPYTAAARPPNHSYAHT